MGFLKKLANVLNRIDTSVQTGKQITKEINKVLPARSANTPPKTEIYWPTKAVLDGDYTGTLYIPEDYCEDAMDLVESLVDENGSWMGYAELVPEPDNPYDEGAIFAAVNGQYLAHLSLAVKEHALRKYYSKDVYYIKVFVQAHPHRRYPSIHIATSDKHLNAARDEEMALIRAAKDRRRSCWLKECKKYSEEILAAYRVYGDKAPCTFSVDEQPKGKYKGEPRITVHVPKVGGSQCHTSKMARE